mgnify:CR=1 FL=1
MSSGDLSPLEQRLREALEQHFAAVAPEGVTAEVAARIGQARTAEILPILLRALERAGDLLEERRGLFYMRCPPRAFKISL